MLRPDLDQILEALLCAADRPLGVPELLALFGEEDRPEAETLRQALEILRGRCEGRAVELVEVASGFRLQVRREFSPWVARLSEERPARYSRALLETLAIVAYRQPVTRAEIEEVRGVAVSTNIVRTLLEREWIRVVGHREVPGRPALYGTTRIFLDYFSLKSLGQLPVLSESDLTAVFQEELTLAAEEGSAGEGVAGQEAVAAPAEVAETMH